MLVINGINKRFALHYIFRVNITANFFEYSAVKAWGNNLLVKLFNIEVHFVL